MLRAQGRDLHAEFLELLPERPRPISIQRWSVRRIGLAVLTLLLASPSSASGGAGSSATRTSKRADPGADAPCAPHEPLLLMAQSVPTASLVPCIEILPAAGRSATWWWQRQSRFTLTSDRVVSWSVERSRLV
jgi:hypothetical protein